MILILNSYNEEENDLMINIALDNINNDFYKYFK
jgi:hypothetical protein